ncbi:MAG: DUF4148 domain-containing protein [Rhizobacter sp.]
MNRKHTLTALTFLLATSAAFAQSGELDLQHFGATQPAATSRAAVRAEVLKARADGESLVPKEADIAGVFQKAPANSNVTRAQVRAEVLQAQADGTLVRPEVNVGAEPFVASTRSRDDVRKEAVAATRSGQSRGVGAGR